MIVFDPHQHPEISVIITCYNQGRFLADAIKSVLTQTVHNFEIMVVDDGSSDNTKDVAAGFAEVQYVYQTNSGLSAARNTGIARSRGRYLVFLDADDWLYGNALETNLDHLKRNPDHAFVSGWHDKVDEWNYPIATDEQIIVEKDHYRHLLKGNYIGMHACVMYQRWALEDFRFDTTLKACEDYDMYFRIARDFVVGNHSGKLAAYRIHGNNMSSRIPFMLEHALKVCRKQEPFLRDATEKRAFREGLRNWKSYYTNLLYRALMERMKSHHQWATTDELLVLMANSPNRLLRYCKCKLADSTRETLKSRLPERLLKTLHRLGVYKHYTPKPGHVSAGDFDRKTPFSYDFGFDRGGAIDRFYIENFLAGNSSAVKGSVLEIGDNEYTLRYGGEKVLKSDILHIDASNSKATYIGDITNVPQIASGQFDCIIFTQTLHLIYDFKSALHTCYRILKPGGTLLLTVPGISHIDHGEWRDYWLWSFTDKSIRRLMKECFQEKDIEISTYGNVYVAAAFLYGMGLPEFKKDFLFHHDPSYQVIISAKATKN